MRKLFTILTFIASLTAVTAQTKPATKKAEIKKECEVSKDDCCEKTEGNHCSDTNKEKPAVKKAATIKKS